MKISEVKNRSKRGLILGIVAVMVLLQVLTGCSGADTNNAGILPNEWYSTEHMDGVQCYNCAITDAFPRASGGVFATYLPVCESCHEPGPLSTAIFDEEESYSTVWNCDCGTGTSIYIIYNP